MNTTAQPHIVRFVRNFVRKLRDAGIPETNAESFSEDMAQVVLREELKEFATNADLALVRKDMAEMEIRLKLAISEAVRQVMIWTVAVQGLGIAILVLLLR